VRLGAEPDDLERLAATHDACAAHLAVVRTRLRGAVRDSWSGPAAERWWAELDRSVLPVLIVAGQASAAAAGRLRSAANEQRLASLARPEHSIGQPARTGAWIGRCGPHDADLVMVLVPGAGTDLRDIDVLRRRSERLWEVTVARAGSAAVMGRSAAQRIAVVAWLGYDPPDGVLAAVDPRPARDGADALAAEVASLRGSGAQRVVVVGHSYGGLVASLAAAGGMDADEVVLLGSPGLGVGDRESLDLPPGADLWAAAAERDPVSAIARSGVVHGPDPVGVALSLPTSRTGHGSYFTDPVLLGALAEVALGLR
jgi:pimeloyl-ACP methyl ester carboxylesterase